MNINAGIRSWEKAQLVLLLESMAQEMSCFEMCQVVGLKIGFLPRIPAPGHLLLPMYLCTLYPVSAYISS